MSYRLFLPFLSTLSLRRATLRWSRRPRCSRDFYPRSPCGERRTRLLPSIGRTAFLSTLSLRRATFSVARSLLVQLISIHALLAESDGTTLPTDATTALFLSTLSLRRATCTAKADATRVNNFYPRSPCGERPVATTTATIRCYFYPRSPCGERRRCPQWRCLPIAISIHALLAESDLRPPCFRGRQKISIHALLAESDLPWHRPAWISSTFLSTLSLRRATR